MDLPEDWLDSNKAILISIQPILTTIHVQLKVSRTVKNEDGVHGNNSIYPKTE